MEDKIKAKLRPSLGYRIVEDNKSVRLYPTGRATLTALLFLLKNAYPRHKISLQETYVLLEKLPTDK